jgi:hypothetical protein
LQPRVDLLMDVRPNCRDIAFQSRMHFEPCRDV